MQTVKSNSLKFIRAGSDYLGYGWSAHVTGFTFQQSEHYLIERDDGTTFEVGAAGRDRIDGVWCWHIVDEDVCVMLGL